VWPQEGGDLDASDEASGQVYEQMCRQELVQVQPRHLQARPRTAADQGVHSAWSQCGRNMVKTFHATRQSTAACAWHYRSHVHRAPRLGRSRHNQNQNRKSQQQSKRLRPRHTLA
jgi:hypothetical protein